MRHNIFFLILFCCALAAIQKPAAAQPNAALSPSEITFYKFDFDTEPVSFTGFSVHNVGNQPLHFVTPGFSVTGPDADQFSAISLTVLDPVPPHSSLSNYRVYFRPTARGTYHAVLNVHTNDPDSPVTTMPLTGVAAYSELSLTPTAHHFGFRSVNDGPTTVGFTLASLGVLPVEFETTGIEIIGNSAYSITEMPTTATMETGSSRTLVAAFDPTVEGAQSAKIRFYTNDTKSPLREISLQGFGTWAELEVSPFSLNFGNKVISDPEPTVLTANITNWGTEALQFTGSAFSLVGPGASSFSIIDAPSTTPLNIGDPARQIKIGFKPTTVGSKFASLRITTNDPDTPVFNVSLTGNALPPRTTPFVGPYDGYGPGTSTIGTGGHYASLYDACEAASAAPLSGGNWTFQILNDLNETKNSMLATENRGGNKLLFRPAPNTSATVSFVNTTQNPREFPGHFVIGARYYPGTPTGEWRYLPTGNVIIDGSNDPTTTSQNLTFRNPEIQGGTTSLIHVAGDCDNVVIKNCHFYHTTGFYTSVNGGMGPVEFVGERTVPTVNPSRIFSSADDCTVQHCNFLVNGFQEAPAITSNFRSSSFSNFPVVPSSRGLRFLDNSISTPHQGIYVRDSDEVEVRNNHIVLTEPGQVFRTQAGIILNPASDAGSSATSIVDGNLIQFGGTTPSVNSQTGILFSTRSTTSTFTITNNMISGLAAPAPHQTQHNRIAIASNIDENTTSTIAHNSISFHTLPDTTTTLGRVAAFEFAFVNQIYEGYTLLRNNMIRMGTEGGVIFKRMPGPGVLDSDNNIIYTVPLAHVGLIPFIGGGAKTTLADWQAATGGDINSIVRDPMVAIGMGNPGVWMGSPGQPNPDMHFNRFPGGEFLVPAVEGIPTDFDGEARYPVQTMAGADEVDQSTGVKMWELY